MPKTKKKSSSKRFRPYTKSMMPTQINMHPVHVRVYRFTCPTAGSYYVTRRCMLSLQACLSVSATTAITLIQAIRLRRVSVWACSTSGLASVNIEWTDPYGPSTQLTATGTSTEPCHLTSRPPAGSFAGLWSQVTNTGNYNDILCQLTLLAGSTVDVECEVVYADGVVSNEECISRSTNTAGIGVYYAHLDNSGTGGGAGTKTITTTADNVVNYTT